MDGNNAEVDIWNELYTILKRLPGDYIVHKNSGDICVFPVMDGDTGPELFMKLHNRHEDIIRKIVNYGWVLLRRKQQRHLKIIAGGGQRPGWVN